MATRFDPFQDMDRLVGEMFGSARAAATMPMDFFRSGDHYVLHCDLPGVDPGTIDLNVEDRTLTLRAERSADEHDVQWFLRERATGSYVRQITVGRGMALDRIDATYSDGVLTLSIPVSEDAKPRKIEVQHGSQPATITQSAEHRADTSSSST